MILKKQILLNPNNYIFTDVYIKNNVFRGSHIGLRVVASIRNETCHEFAGVVYVYQYYACDRNNIYYIILVNIIIIIIIVSAVCVDG